MTYIPVDILIGVFWFNFHILVEGTSQCLSESRSWASTRRTRECREEGELDLFTIREPTRLGMELSQEGEYFKRETQMRRSLLRSLSVDFISQILKLYF